MMILKYKKTCECGAVCDPGTDVQMRKVEYRSGGSGLWEVCSCPSCDDNRDRGGVDMSCQKRATSMADAIRNRRARDAKKRAKESRR